MNMTCACGGRRVAIDHSIPKPPTEDYPHTTYTTFRIRSGYAAFRCPSCRKTVYQRLRVAKKEN